MKLPVIVSLCLIVALAAPSSFAANAKPQDKPAAKPAAKPAVPTVQQPRPFTWPIIKSWYDEGEDARALQAARLLGRPIAIAWYVKGRPRGPVKRLKRSLATKYFVCLAVTDKPVKRDGKTEVTMTNRFLKKVYEASGLGAYPKAPCLFMATWEGEYLGLFKGLGDAGRRREVAKIRLTHRQDRKKASDEIQNTPKEKRKDAKGVEKEESVSHWRMRIAGLLRDRLKAIDRNTLQQIKQRDMAWTNALNAAAKDAAKKYGGLVKDSHAHSGWKGLMAARKLWHDGKYDAAMKHYRTAISVAKVNPSMELAVELNKDVAAINHRGAEQLAVVEGQFMGGELDEAEAGVRKVHSTYKGFETATNAQELFDKIRVAQGERAVVAKETKKDPVADPPTRPAANDKPAANDEKKDDGDDNKKGEEDGGYEEDF